MRSSTRFALRLAVAAGLVAALGVGLAAPAHAKTRADCEREYRPQRAQDGKDVIWVPTEDTMVPRMLAMAKVTSADTLYDLGAGDGKIPIEAAKRFGATAVGIEYDAGLVQHAQCLVEAEGVQDRVTMIQGDIFETDFSDATVVTLYLLPALNLRLRPTLLAMNPGTRVVSYSFTMGDWGPDEFIDSDDGSGSAYFWIVPARVDGDWTFRPAAGGAGLDVTIAQTFQKIRGSAGGAELAGQLSGEQIELAFTDGGEHVTFRGAVVGERIEGALERGGTPVAYVATRRR